MGFSDTFFPGSTPRPGGRASLPSSPDDDAADAPDDSGSDSTSNAPVATPSQPVSSPAGDGDTDGFPVTTVAPKPSARAALVPRAVVPVASTSNEAGTDVGGNNSPSASASTSTSTTTPPAPSFPVPEYAPQSRPARFNYTVFANDPRLADAFAPQIAQERQRQAQDAVDDAQAYQQSLRSRDAEVNRQSQLQGFRTIRDGDGNLQPLTDDQGRTLYHPYDGKIAYSGPNGRAVQSSRDEFGNVTSSDPDANPSVGPNDANGHDPQLYRQNKYRPWEPIGHVDDLAADDSQPDAVRRAAKAWQQKRTTAQMRPVLQTAQGQATAARQAQVDAQSRLGTLKAQIDGLTPSFDPATNAPLNDAARDSLAAGAQDGSTDPAAKTAAIARGAERQKQLDGLTTERQQLEGQLGTHGKPGPLILATKAAEADSALTYHLAQAGNVAKLVDYRRNLNRQNGTKDESDPILQQLLQQQQEWGTKATAAQVERDQTMQRAADEGHLPGAQAQQPSNPGVPATADGTASVATPPANTTPASNGNNPVSNLAREAFGGLAAGTIHVAEGAYRATAEQDAATPESVNAHLDAEIAQRRQALTEIDKLPEAARGQMDTARKRIEGELVGLEAKRQDPRLQRPGDAPGFGTPGLLTPQGQQQRNERTAGSDRVADTLRDAAEDASTSAYGQDPAKKNTIPVRIAHTVGEAVPLLAASAIPGAGTVAAAGTAALQAKANTYDEALAEAVKSGMVDAKGEPTPEAKAQAHSISDAAAIRTIPEMVAFMGAGKLTASAAAKLLSPNAPRLTRFLVASAFSTAGNAGAGTANKVFEQIAQGKPIDPSYSLEQAVQDTLFGVMHGVGATRKNNGPAIGSPDALAATPPEQVAANFAERHPDAPKLDPRVITASHGFVPPSASAAPEPLARADARLRATQEIYAQPDWQPPTDAAGKPTAEADPARDRETASATFKLANGFGLDELTSAEQARLKPKGEPPLARKGPDGSTILTDAGRQFLAQAAPTARQFINGTEAEELRARQKSAPVPGDDAVAPAPTSPAGEPPAPAGTAPAGGEAAPAADSTDRKTSGAGASSQPRQESTVSPVPVQAEPPATADATRPAPSFSPGDTPQARAEAFQDGHGTAAHFAPDETIPADLADNPRVRLPDGSTVVYDAEMHEPGDFGADAQPVDDGDLSTRQQDASNGDRSEENAGRSDQAKLPPSPSEKRGMSTPEPAAPVHDQPEPTTQRGITARNVVETLEAKQHEARAAGTELLPGEQRMLDRQRAILAEELAKPGGSRGPQELAADRGGPLQPNTTAGKRAQFTVEKLERFRDGGGLLSPGDWDTLHASREIVRADLDAQRRAPRPNEPAAAAGRQDDLAVGDTIRAGKRTFTVSGFGTGEQSHLVQITNNENGGVLRIARENALAQRVGRAPAAPAESPTLTVEQMESVHQALDRGESIPTDVAEGHGVVLPPHYAREGDSFVPGEETMPASSRAQSAAEATERLRAKQRSGEPLTAQDRDLARSVREQIDEERRRDRLDAEAAAAPRTDRDLEAEDRARREHEAELQRQGHEGMEGAGGVELLDALRQAGGLPTTDAVFRGELERVRQASQAAHLAGRKGTWNLFRHSGLPLDELAARLREQGFDFQTPADMLDAIERRVASQKEQYGFPARDEAQSGMERSAAYYRRQPPAPRTPEELAQTVRTWRTFLQRVAPKTALRLEVIRKSQLASLWRGQGRAPDDVHAAFMDGTIYLVHEALEANPTRTSVVNVLHEAAHSYERTLPEPQQRALRAQWQAEMRAGKSPLHGADGRMRAEVDQRAATDFSEWLAERLGWENAEWAQGRANANSPVARFAQSMRDLFLKLYHAFRPQAVGESAQAMDARFRSWLTTGTPGIEGRPLDGRGAQAAIRDWFRRFGRDSHPEKHGQLPAQEVGSERENAAPQAGLDPVTSTPLDPQFERAVDEYHGGGSTEGRRGGPAPDPAPAQLEGNPDGDAEAAVRAAGGEPARDTLVRRAGDTGLAVKEFVARLTGQRDGGVPSGAAHEAASSLLRRSLDDPSLSSEQRSALADIRSTVPLIRENDFLRHVDAAHLLHWVREQETEGRSLEGLAAVRHTQSYADSLRTLEKLFPAQAGDKSDLPTRLERIAREQTASGQRPRLQVLGVGGEGTVFQDLDGRGTYKIHPGGATEAAQGIRSIQPDEKGTGTHVDAGAVPATEAALRYLRQSSLPISSPTEIKGISENGRLITRQPLLDAARETTPAEIDEMMARAGGRRIQVRGTNNALRNSFAVPDGRGNWMMAVDMKPANVLRERATGEPRLTDGILAPITPEVLRDNPQLADYPATRPEAQFARRVARAEGTGDLFDDERGARAEAPEWQRFAPESGTLGIPRDQMPQIKSEHRGALTNFLAARGIRSLPGEVPPASLKPSQAEFSPAKVERARTYDGPQRRILVSKDNHVIDGHHEQLRALQDEPERPMPVTRIMAPARDILAQMHEFPSAGMEAPPTLPRLRSGERQGDLLSGQSEDLRLIGEEGIDHGARRTAKEQAERDHDENRVRQDEAQGALFARRAGLDPEKYRPATDEERSRLAIPPAWTDVHVATDPDARRIAVGRDSKGRVQSRYSEAHTSQAQADKFERGQRFNAALPGIMERVRQSLASGDGREEAAVLRLIHASAFRNGGDEDTGAETKAYGASNLRAEHITTDGDTTRFDFPGKLGVRQQHSITDPELTDDLRRRAAGGGALFNTNDAKVRAYLKGSGDWKVHDFRTWNATDLAAKEVASTPHPQTAEEFWNQRDRIGDQAANKLGDTRQIALESYVDPAVFEPWKSALNITDDARPRRSSAARGEAEARDARGGTPPTDAGLLRDSQLPARPAAGEADATGRDPGGLDDPQFARRAASDTVEDEPSAASVLREPIGTTDALRVAKAHVEAQRPLLERLGIRDVRYTRTEAASGVEFGTDGSLRIEAPKLARSMEAVRDLQARKGIAGTPDDWLAAVVRHEAIHAADNMVAHDNGQTFQQRYDSLLDEAMPHGWEQAGRKAAGAEWDTLPRWKQKAEFSRMVMEGRWQGKITEQLYRMLKATADYLRRVAGFDGTDPRFEQHVSEIEQRLEAARNSPEVAKPSEDGQPWPDEAQFARRGGLKQNLQAVRDAWDSREAKGRISGGVDAAETRAGELGQQAANEVRQQFGTAKELARPDAAGNRDLEAMPFVVEAHGNKATLASDLAKIKASTDPELAKQFAPVVQHAIDHFARLDGMKARYEAAAQKQLAIERRHGIDQPRFQGDVMRRLELPEHQRTLEPILLGKGPRYATSGHQFEKLADAIQAGYKPRTTNLADLLQHRIAAGQQMVQSRRLYNELKTLKVPGDKAGRSIVADPTPVTLPNGKVEMQTPPGYETVETAGVPLTVHKQFADTVRDLYADSAVRSRVAGRLALQAAAFAKHGTFIADTFHAGRMMYKQATGGGGFGWNDGVALLEHSDDDLARRVASGEIPQSVADWAKANRPAADELVKAGLNVGKFADNLLDQMHGLVEKVVPGVGRLNHWIFNKVSRGAMISTALKNYERNLSRFPELGREGAARQTAQEMNKLFGNLGRQGIFKSRTMQDLARLVLIAPQWVESQLRAEASMYKQAGMVIPHALRGRLRVGTLAQQGATGALAMLALAQVLNYATRGQPTWDNKEDGHKLDAFIPGGKRGFFFSPMSMVAEYTHDMMHYHEHGEGVVESAAHIAQNKLAPGMRGLSEAVSGHDASGKKFPDTATRVRAAAIDSIPSPMPLSALVEKDPRGVAGNGPMHDVRGVADHLLAPLGYRVNRQPGSIEKQLLASVGLKVTPARSAASEMFDLARPYRPDYHSDQPSKYTQLRQAIEQGDDAGAKDEIRALVRNHGMTPEKIGERAFQIKDGTVGAQVFTGSKDGDKLMLARLTPEQRQLYLEAQQEHHENARTFQRLAGELRGETTGQPANRDKAMAVLALRNNNLSLVNTLLDQGRISRDDLPTLRKQAKQGGQTHQPAITTP